MLTFVNQIVSLRLVELVRDGPGLQVSYRPDDILTGDAGRNRGAVHGHD